MVASFFYSVQVLTGEIPFRDVQQTELGLSVVQGLRPAKPGNALAIRFSDPLWGFVQRCWDGNVKLRPKVAESVYLQFLEIGLNALDDYCVNPSLDLGLAASCDWSSRSGDGTYLI